MKSRNRYRNLDAYKAKCREEIYQYREELLGVGHAEVRNWWAAYPAKRPEAGRVRFLQIWAMGGPVGLEASEFGLRVAGSNIRNTWLLILGSERSDSSYQLHLWVRPRRTESTRQHTAKGCDAELHDGWNGEKFRQSKRRVRTGKILYRGTVKQCCEHAATLFKAWDAAQRLGGIGTDDPVFIG